MTLNLVSRVGQRSATLLGLLVMLGCSSAKSPLAQERSTVVTADAGGVTEADQATTEPPTSPAPSADEPSANDGHWVLVQSKDSNRDFAESWNYDDNGRLVEARVMHVRRDIDPYYAVDVTITYAGDHVTSVHDAEPEDLVDSTYDYDLEAGRVVEYSQTHSGEVNDTRTFAYDAEGRLSGSHEVSYGNDITWTLERRESGAPFRLLNNDEVACFYDWRLGWLGTTCYTDGEATQTYLPDASKRLGHMTLGNTTVVYTYDADGRLTSQTAGSSVYEYRYSPDAKLLETLSPDARESRVYDARGLLQEVSWTDGSSTQTRTFTYERVSVDEVVETETYEETTIVRTFKRLSHAPIGEPQLPSFWTELGMDQPSVYIAPTDYSQVP